MEWVSLTLVLLVLGFYALSRIFGDKKKTPQKSWLDDAIERAEDIKAVADAQLEEELKSNTKDRETLEKIKAMRDDEERLRALAEFGNRRRR